MTLILGIGIFAGKSGPDLIPTETCPWIEFFPVTALSMVAFLLRGSLTAQNLANTGREVPAATMLSLRTVGRTGRV